jgi:hypothetical protein
MPDAEVQLIRKAIEEDNAKTIHNRDLFDDHFAWLPLPPHVIEYLDIQECGVLPEEMQPVRLAALVKQAAEIPLIGGIVAQIAELAAPYCVNYMPLTMARTSLIASQIQHEERLSGSYFVCLKNRKKRLLKTLHSMRQHWVDKYELGLDEVDWLPIREDDSTNETSNVPPAGFDQSHSPLLDFTPNVSPNRTPATMAAAGNEYQPLRPVPDAGVGPLLQQASIGGTASPSVSPTRKGAEAKVPGAKPSLSAIDVPAVDLTQAQIERLMKPIDTCSNKGAAGSPQSSVDGDKVPAAVLEGTSGSTREVHTQPVEATPPQHAGQSDLEAGTRPDSVDAATPLLGETPA